MSIRWAVASALWVTACAPAGEQPLKAGTGRVEAALSGTGSNVKGSGGVDALNEIVVTVARVTAHSSTSGWVTLSSTPTTIDVLRLADFATPLGFAQLPAGHVTQIRLILDEIGPRYVARKDGTHVDLKVPSGLQSGIKIKGPFVVGACATTHIPLVFDAKKSIWVHPTGQGDEWILRPVIRVGKTASRNVGCDDGSTGGHPGSGGEGINETGGGSPGGNGAVCGNGSQCLSGSCVEGHCMPGGPDAACLLGTDCASLVCQSGTCGLGPAGGTGVSCGGSVECLSGTCVNGRCEPSSPSQPCRAPSDCSEGSACVEGACVSLN